MSWFQAFFAQALQFSEQWNIFNESWTIVSVDVVLVVRRWIMVDRKRCNLYIWIRRFGLRICTLFQIRITNRTRSRLCAYPNQRPIDWKYKVETFQTRSEKLVLMTRLLLGIPEMSQLWFALGRRFDCERPKRKIRFLRRDLSDPSVHSTPENENIYHQIKWRP